MSLFSAYGTTFAGQKPETACHRQVCKHLLAVIGSTKSPNSISCVLPSSLGAEVGIFVSKQSSRRGPASRVVKITALRHLDDFNFDFAFISDLNLNVDNFDIYISTFVYGARLVAFLSW